jgi:hypothetical protein
MKKYWKFNLHLCQEQLRNVRVSQFSIVPRKTWRKLWHSYISKLFLTKMQVKFSIFFHRGSLNRELSSTKTGSYPHKFLCRTNCSACADYQPWIIIILNFIAVSFSTNKSFMLIPKDKSLHQDASQGMYTSKIEICFFTARILQNQRMLCCGESFHD